MDRNDWLKFRTKGIGGSESSAILGMNPYLTNIELWEIKTGRKIQEDISKKEYVKYGLEAEKHLTELFKLDYPEYEVFHKDFDLRHHPEYPYILGSLDGELTEKKTGRKGILEIKTTNILNSMHRENWNDKIPQNYYIQCIHYLLITNFDFLILKAHLKSIWRDEIRINTRHYKIERKDVEIDIKFLKTKIIEFWEKYVLKDVRPNLILPAI